MTSEKPVNIQLRIGLPLGQSGLSDAKLGVTFGNLSDDSPIFITHPVSIHYSDVQHGFDIPPSHVVIVGQSAGVIIEIFSSAALQYVDLKNAHQIALDLCQRLEKAGWPRSSSYPQDFASVEKEFRDSPAYLEPSKYYGEWNDGRCDGTRLCQAKQ